MFEDYENISYVSLLSTVNLTTYKFTITVIVVKRYKCSDAR